MDILEFPAFPEDLTSKFEVAECLEHIPADLKSRGETRAAGECGVWPAAIPTNVSLECPMARERAHMLMFLYNSVPGSMAKWVHGDLGDDLVKQKTWKTKLQAWEKDIRHTIIGSKSIFRRAVRAHVLSHNARIHIDNLWLGYQYHLKPIDGEGPDAARGRLAAADSFRLSHDHHVSFLDDLIARKKESSLDDIAELQQPGKNPDSVTLTLARRKFNHYDLISQKNNRSVFVDEDFSNWIPGMISDEQKLFYCDMTMDGKFAFWNAMWQDKKERGGFFVNWYWRYASKIDLLAAWKNDSIMLNFGTRFIRLAQEAWELEAERMLYQYLTIMLNIPTLGLSLIKSDTNISNKLISVWKARGEEDEEAFLAAGFGPGDIPIRGRGRKRHAENPTAYEDEPLMQRTDQQDD